jgi:hypothetical protein
MVKNESFGNLFFKNLEFEKYRKIYVSKSQIKECVFKNTPNLRLA